jgi:PilZ domain
MEGYLSLSVFETSLPQERDVRLLAPFKVKTLSLVDSLDASQTENATMMTDPYSAFEWTDRRRHERYRMRGTAWFQWNDAKGKRQAQTGSVRDVASRGLFIEAVEPPPVGAEILIQFEFENMGRNLAASISTRGEVRRVETLDEQRWGFAASTRRMNLHKAFTSIRVR